MPPKPASVRSEELESDVEEVVSDDLEDEDNNVPPIEAGSSQTALVHL